MADDNRNDQLAKLIAAIESLKPLAVNSPDLAKTLAELERQRNVPTVREKYLKRLRTRMNRLPLADSDDAGLAYAGRNHRAAREVCRTVAGDDDIARSRAAPVGLRAERRRQ